MCFCIIGLFILQLGYGMLGFEVVVDVDVFGLNVVYIIGEGQLFYVVFDYDNVGIFGVVVVGGDGVLGEFGVVGCFGQDGVLGCSVSCSSGLVIDGQFGGNGGLGGDGGLVGDGGFGGLIVVMFYCCGGVCGCVCCFGWGVLWCQVCLVCCCCLL